ARRAGLQDARVNLAVVFNADSEEAIVDEAVLLNVVEDLPVDQAGRAVEPDAAGADAAQREDQVLELFAAIDDRAGGGEQFVEPRLWRRLLGFRRLIPRGGLRPARPGQQAGCPDADLEQIPARSLTLARAVTSAVTHHRSSYVLPLLRTVASAGA